MWRGVPKPVALSSPAAGQPAVYIPPQEQIECVRAVTFTLTTVGGATIRRPLVRFLDGKGTPVAVNASAFTLSTGHAQVVSFQVGGQTFGVNDGAEVGGPLYERWLDGLVRLQIAVDAMAAGDKLTNIRLDVVGYPAEWYDDTDG